MSVPIFVMISDALFLKKDDIPLKSYFFCIYYLKFHLFLFSGKSVIYQLVELTKTNRINSLISVINGIA